MRRRSLDYVLLGGLAVLLVAGAADALRSGSSSRSSRALPACRASQLSLDAGIFGPPGPNGDSRSELTVRNAAGSPCRLAPLRLSAAVRDVGGRILYRGPASRSPLAGELDAGQQLIEPFLTRLPWCGTRGPLRVTLSGAGLSARPRIECPWSE
jgi:hypothetical protein